MSARRHREGRKGLHMSARLHALRGWNNTAGHTDAAASQPMPFAPLTVSEGGARIDTHRVLPPVPQWRGQTPAEAARMAELRQRAADDARANRISTRVWTVWALIFVGTLLASHYFPGHWGYWLSR